MRRHVRLAPIATRRRPGFRRGATRGVRIRLLPGGRAGRRDRPRPAALCEFRVRPRLRIAGGDRGGGAGRRAPDGRAWRSWCAAGVTPGVRRGTGHDRPGHRGRDAGHRHAGHRPWHGAWTVADPVRDPGAALRRGRTPADHRRGAAGRPRFQRRLAAHRVAGGALRVARRVPGLGGPAARLPAAVGLGRAERPARRPPRRRRAGADPLGPADGADGRALRLRLVRLHLHQRPPAQAAARVRPEHGPGDGRGRAAGPGGGLGPLCRVHGPASRRPPGDHPHRHLDASARRRRTIAAGRRRGAGHGPGAGGGQRHADRGQGRAAAQALRPGRLRLSFGAALAAGASGPDRRANRLRLGAGAVRPAGAGDLLGPVPDHVRHDLRPGLTRATPAGPACTSTGG
jgi:hypothetical protein